jgi:hypothetical protein
MAEIKADLAQRRRGIKTLDLIVFGGLCLLYTAVGIGAILTKQEWTAVKIVILALSWGTFVGLTLTYFIHKWLARPDFITKHGTAVWTDNIARITPDLMKKALDRFIEVMEAEQKEVTRDEIEAMLSRTGIEWEIGKVSLWAGRYELKNKAGIQWGYRLLVQWKGSIGDSALYHELLHEVNECIRLPKLPPEKQMDFRLKDVKHEDPDWWRLEGLIIDTY